MAWTVAGILFVTSIVFALLALHENSVADGWHRDYVTASTELAAARSSIRTLNKQVSSLNGQVGSLNTQLAAQASAKEKALDQDTVVSQLLNQEGSVSTELNTCVNDLETLIGTIGNDLSNDYYTDPSVLSEVDTASSDCNQAQSANDSLQSSLSGATG